MNTEVTIPLTIGPATADLKQGQGLLAALTASLRVATGRGPATIGVQHVQPQRLFRCLLRPQVGDRVRRGHAPWQVPVTYPPVGGELKAVRYARKPFSATATSSVRINDSPAGAVPGITLSDRGQPGCPRHSGERGGVSGIADALATAVTVRDLAYRMIFHLTTGSPRDGRTQVGAHMQAARY